MDKKKVAYINLKRIEVLSKLSPIANLIDVDLDYVLDTERRIEYLVCDGQKICTTNNSFSGIEEEFWGYVHIKKYSRQHRFSKHNENVIKRYWFDNDFNQPWIKH